MGNGAAPGPVEGVKMTIVCADTVRVEAAEDERASIPGIPYEWSSNGQVYRVGKDKPLTIQHAPGGWQFTRISVQGRGVTAYLHEWIARAFYGMPPTGYKPVHANGDRSDNRVANLIYTWAEPEHVPSWAERWDGNAWLYAPTDTVRSHGRIKVATHCRNGHRLSMTGEPDHNTMVWGYGNRICTRCNDTTGIHT